MRKSLAKFGVRFLILAVIGAFVLVPQTGRAAAPDAAFDAVVGLKVTVPPEARSAKTLGTERNGSGALIDSSGLIVTIGYLIMEASGIEVQAGGKSVPATVVGYDPETGFGLVRATLPLGIKPIQMGSTKDVGNKETVVAASHVGGASASPAVVVAKRRFAGYWEYMLDEAIFTAPPIVEFGGAALISSQGKLVGIGSLFVANAVEEPRFPGNMFVPIDLLRPILGDMLALGKPGTPPRPWLGMNSDEARGHVFVTRVTPDSPAAQAGVATGDMILSVGNQKVDTLAGLYGAIWGLGPAGQDVPLTVLRGGDVKQLRVKSIDRMQFMKTGTSY